jgi:hypothetical protein
MVSLAGAIAVMAAGPVVAKDKGAKGSHGAPPAAGPSASGGSSKSGSAGNDASSKAQASVNVRVSIGSDERRVIQDYVDGCGASGKPGRRGQGLPPGLAKKVARGGDLPPGWEKKLVPGTIMSLDLFRCCHPLPRDLVVKLPPPPPGTILVAVGGRVVRVNESTREIHGVFEVRL